jgi:adenylosuccinate synthase
MAKDLCSAGELFNLNRNLIKTVGVFEGAQGLMLDEFLGDFPHVTRSITGLPYALLAAQELGVKSIRPIYVTRTYTSRHGAGPLTGSGVETGCNIVDKTNVENEWQGAIRFAPLNLKELSYFIKQDIARGSGVAQIFDIEVDTPTLAVTCFDQCSDKVFVIDLNGSLVSVKKENLIDYISNALGMLVTHVSSGPTSSDVKYLGKNYIM